MFDNLGKNKKKDDDYDDDAVPASGHSGSRSGPTAYPRRSSWFPQYASSSKSFQWLIYDNQGSYNGWFDWLPLWMRVGYWSPVTCLFLLSFYGSLCYYRPRLSAQTTFRPDQEEEEATTILAIDAAICLWGLFVMTHACRTLGSIAPFYLSYTGWSWILLTVRAGSNALALAMRARTSYDYTTTLTTLLNSVASSLRFPVLVAAVITCTIWNFILFPLIYFVSIPKEQKDKRHGFLKFNGSFFMMNVHVLNLPLSIINTLVVPTSRDTSTQEASLFTHFDLWMAYVILGIYSAFYLLVLDRLGMHFYPIFCPRSSACPLSVGLVLMIYYQLWTYANAWLSGGNET